jgi:hypothetical protein
MPLRPRPQPRASSLGARSGPLLSANDLSTQETKKRTAKAHISGSVTARRFPPPGPSMTRRRCTRSRRSVISRRGSVTHWMASKGFFNHPDRIMDAEPNTHPARFKLMIRALIYATSITTLAAVLAIVATAITTQWQRQHRATAVAQLASLL